VLPTRSPWARAPRSRSSRQTIDYSESPLSVSVLLSGLAEHPAALAGGGSTSVEAADHGVDRSPADQCLGHCGITFVVAGQAKVGGQPGKAAFEDSPLRMYREADLASGLADDLDGGVERCGGPVDQPAGEALVGEHVPDRREQIGAEQDRLCAVAVLPRRRHHADLERLPQRCRIRGLRCLGAATGLALAIIGYDKFAAVEPHIAQTVLDIFAGQARHAALVGHRMLCSVQSDDTRITFAPVGATPVAWNDAE
jgi:hypothetical protein